MKPWKEVIDGIRNAVLGKEVREDIAQMGEYVEQFANTAGENIQKAIDPTLSLSGKAADARAAGNAIKTEKSRATNAETALDNKKADKTDLDVERKRIDVLNDGGLNLKDEVIDTSIKAWLDSHPEATTTVQDGAITEQKINPEFLQHIKKDYVTPQMFGAKGDGVTDDTWAIQRAVDFIENKIKKNEITSNIIYFPAGIYMITGLKINYPICFEGEYTNFYANRRYKNGSTIKALSGANDFLIQFNSSDVSEQKDTTLRGTFFRNINFDGSNLDINCFNFIFCGWEMRIENVCISFFNKSAIVTDTSFDTVINGLTIQNCGTKVGDKCYYCMDLGGQQGTTNAWHFFALHIEFTNYAIHFSKAEDIAFSNSKFEVATSDEPTFLFDSPIDYRMTFENCYFMMSHTGESYTFNITNEYRVLGNIEFVGCHYVNTTSKKNSKFLFSSRPISIIGCDFSKLYGGYLVHANSSIVTSNTFNFDDYVNILDCTDSIVSNNKFESVNESSTGVLIHGSDCRIANNDYRKCDKMTPIEGESNCIIRTSASSKNLFENSTVVCSSDIDVSSLPILSNDTVKLFNNTLNPLYVSHDGVKYWYASESFIKIERRGKIYRFSQRKIENSTTNVTEDTSYNDIPTDCIAISNTINISNGKNGDNIIILNNSSGPVDFGDFSIPSGKYSKYRYWGGWKHLY